MEKEKISVIIPIYNVEKYIHKCVDSIVNQTYKNLEIILVDDGSPDLCPEICDAYAKSDARIHVIHKQNGGLSSARNAGLDVALGEYIAFIDGDDYIHPRMMEDLYSALNKADAECSVCNMQYVDEYNNQIMYYPNNYIKNGMLNAHEVFQKSFEGYGYYYIVVCNKLYKRDIWKKYRFPEGKVHEDEFAFHFILIQCNNIVCLQEAYYYYVQHSGSIMAKESAKKSMDAAEALLERMAFFKDYGLLEFFSIQDYKTCLQLLKLRHIYKNKCEKTRYRQLKNNYKKLHKWGMANVPYPINERIKIRIYRYFPYIVYFCDKLQVKERLRDIKYMMIYIRIYFQSRRIRRKSLDKKCIYFISTPTHGNLGDQAIVYAQYLMMEEIGLQKYVVEISRNEYERLGQKLKKVIHPKELIIIDGGGNIGTLWIEEEQKMRDIIQNFSQNPIFIFPQSAYYEKSIYGQQELKKSVHVYTKHPSLTVFCRDKVTYELLQNKFSRVKSFYTPDMVPFIQNAQIPRRREGILFCFRKDLESVCSDVFKENLKKKLVLKGYAVKESSTLVNCRVGKNSRIKILQQKWEEFLSSKLIITDRLHGMIFCAITGTPCIALDNVSHKVRDGYEWVQYLPYIIYCGKDSAKIEEHVDFFMKKNQEYYYERKPLEPYYVRIKEEVKHAFNQK